MKALLFGVFAALVCAAYGCVPPPSVTVRVRARMQRTQTHSTQALEARLECGWALERAVAHAAPVETQRSLADESSALEPLPCSYASTCRWEAEQREVALAAVMSPALSSSGGAP